MKNFTGKYDNQNRPIFNGSVLKNVTIRGKNYKKGKVYFDLKLSAFIVVVTENNKIIEDFLYKSVTAETIVK
jgi:hypothetical protein